MAEHRSVADIRADLAKLEASRLKLRRELAAALMIPEARASRWKGEALAGLKLDYETRTDKLSIIARDHKTSGGCLCNLAKEHGWVRRAFLEQRQKADAERRNAHAAMIADLEDGMTPAEVAAKHKVKVGVVYNARYDQIEKMLEARDRVRLARHFQPASGAAT